MSNFVDFTERKCAALRKFIVLLVAAMLLCCLTTSVFAAGSVTSAQAFGSVAADGSCQISMTFTVHLEQVEEKLYFPIPSEATGVTLNGSRVSATKSGDVRRINLSRVIGKAAGDFSFHIQYSLHDVIHTTENNTLEMELPLLCGFSYPIEAMDFTVTLPGAVDAKPAFTSGYHQSSIEADLSCTVDAMTITGTALKPLKDHETLSMKLAVTEAMFPRSIVQSQSTDTAVYGMLICAALALIYWLLTLRYLPWGAKTTAEPPEGFDAGSLGCVAALQGVDLSMTVLTWAQLGYVLIRRQSGRQLFLIKRMEMGNERSEFEQRCFQKLFAKRQTVDTASYHYAQLHRALATRPARTREDIHPRTGSATVFRGLAAGIGLFGGAGIGLVMGSGAALQVFLVILLGAAGAVSGWLIVPWGGTLFLHKRPAFYLGLGLSALWLLVAWMAGAGQLGLYMIGGLLAAGLFLRLGGRRTATGKQTCAQIRGLRRFLFRPDKDTLRRQCEADPDYFFRMLPYAMALGVDKAFAAAFGGLRFANCPYLHGITDGERNATQWLTILRKTVVQMEERPNKLPLEKLLGMLHSLTKR